MSVAESEGVRRGSRRRWKLAAVFVAVLAALGAGVWWFSWWAPPTYNPGAGPGLSPSPGGAASHDAGGMVFDASDHDRRTGLLRDAAYVLHIGPVVGEAGGKAGGGELVFFGALHSKDPSHRQLAELRRTWDALRPTVALVEGRMSFFVGTARQGIGVFGEGAAVYALAEGSGVPLYTLEPPLEVEIAALEECGDRRQVAMFRVLSGYMSARRGGPVSDFKISRLLHKRAAPLTDALPTIVAFDAYFASQFPGEPGWREMPEQAMWPGKSDTLLHRMATRSNRARDEHFVRAMVELTRRGERVLAIAGRSHVVILEPNLLELLGPAGYGGLSSARPWEAR